MSRMLVIEDEPTTRLLVFSFLQKLGHRVFEAHNGEAGLRLAMELRPEVVILDINLPDMSGFDVCSALRKASFGGGVLMMTGRSTVSDKVEGFNSGADDYLCKPFDSRELKARIEALIRRNSWLRADSSKCSMGHFEIDLEARSAKRDGKEIALTKTEWSLLSVLVKNAGKPVSRDLMLDSIWGYDKSPSARSIDTHVWRLRKKLCAGSEDDSPIENIHGEGYRFQA